MSHTDSDDPTPYKKQRVGRPEDYTKLEAFFHVTKFIEDNNLAFSWNSISTVEQVVH